MTPTQHQNPNSLFKHHPMTLNLSTQSVLAASIASAHLADFARDYAKYEGAQAAVFKMSWGMAYGHPNPYGLELTLMNGDKLLLAYATQAQQQQDWTLVQAATPHFGKVVKSTPSSNKSKKH